MIVPLAPNRPRTVRKTAEVPSEISPTPVNGQLRVPRSWPIENGCSSPRGTLIAEVNPPQREQISWRVVPETLLPVQSAQSVAPQAVQRQPASEEMWLLHLNSIRRARTAPAA